MEQLLVRLGASFADPVYWLVWSSSDEQIIASGELSGAGELSSLTERAGQRPVIALAPASDILLKWVELPPRAGRKVLNAIPFMLEDELAQDISRQFFALGPKNGDRQAVAVVAHEKMQAWQSWLADADLSCDRLIPDVLAVPYNPEGWSMLALADQILLREDMWKGMQGEADWLIPALVHLAKQKESSLNVINFTDFSLAHIPHVVQSQPPPELPMHVLAKEALNCSFNLLQGQYKVKKKRSGVWYYWRPAAVLALAALCMNLLDKTVTLYQLESQNAQLKQQIDETVSAGFPNIGVYRDVRRKVQSEIARLEQGGGNASLLAMMEQLTPAFAASDIKPQTFRFDAARTEIRIQAIGKDFEALEQFRRTAESAGFVVEQGAINNRENAVIGSIAIRSNS